MVDYPGRSPLFQHVLAGFLLLKHGYIVPTRLGMVGISLVTGALVFLLTSEIHSKKAGLAASSIFLFSPLTLTWGALVKTELLAQLFVLLGLIQVVKSIDKSSERLGTWSILFAGGMFGMGFLTRKAVVTHVAAVVAFLFYYRLRQRNQRPWLPIWDSIVVGIGMAGTLTLGYGYLAWPSIDVFVTIVLHHFASTFSGIPGGLVWAESVLGTRTVVDNPSVIEILIDFVVTYAQYMTTALVSTMLILVYPYILMREYDTSVAKYILLSIAVALLIGSLVLFVLRDAKIIDLLAILPIIGSIIYVVNFGAADRDYFNFSKLWLPILMILVVNLGYLYKGNMTMVYTLDFFPYLSILAGVALVGYIEYLDFKLERPPVSIGVVLLTVAIVLSVLTLEIFLPVAHFWEPNDRKPSISDIEGAGDDLEALSSESASVLASNPLIVLEADREVTVGLSRKIWVVLYHPNSQATIQVKHYIFAKIDNGEVSYVIMGPRMERVLERHPDMKNKIRDCYNPVNRSRYWPIRTIGTLYGHSKTGC
jgi:4-amino-4-deoxy-L-arabinose transferase-like glycosyltransferase